MDVERIVAWLGRWASGRGPLYLLLAVRLRALIDDGLLPPGSALPPDRVLARRLAVGRGTVVAAYDLLQQEGRLVRRQGSGTRVADAELPATRQADGVANPLLLHVLDPPDGVTLLTCAAPVEPPPELIEAYQAAVQRLSRIRHDIGYHPAGHPELRRALAAHHRRRGLPTEPDQILVTTGGQQALSLITALLVTPGGTVRTETPTYPSAIEIFRDAGALVSPCDLAEAHDRGVLSPREPEVGRPALAYVIPTAHNPTGLVMPPAARRRLAGWAAESDTPLIDDQVPADLCFDGDTPLPLAAYAKGEQLITVGSLSKLIWGGLRVGWIRAAAPVVSRLARLRAIHDLGGEVLAQLAAVALLDRVEEIRRDRIAILRRRHDHLRAELARRLPTWSCDPAHGGQTLWVRLPRGDASAYSQLAARHGVAVPPGPAFDSAGDHADRLRLPFTHPEAELTRSVARLAAAWAEYDGTRRRAALHPMVV
ncbi:putative GntR-family regulatory protein [Acrocarpospora phusangensis]|uniref:GntR-family regulatory protein n=1 Tax=Acrocarpospora phusangensis TaxID=1070424 RepID=A0A919QDR3_9ACTN|nr:PLP-dependent aminotransferase family protein [Acrocarpospora phusangensis]GIH25588.1 putative GntR-family regulatory protein [Acrocarpospora phusangensis]